MPRLEKHNRALRVYRVLLAAYPKEFRREYGAQMEQAFRDLCREERRSGVIGLVKLWARVALDLASTATAERIAERKITRHREVEMNERRLVWAGLILVSAPLFFVTARRFSGRR